MHFRDVDRATFAELQAFLSDGKHLPAPGQPPLELSERHSLLAASGDLRVVRRCGCNDPECRTYAFSASREQGRPISFETNHGLAIVFVGSDGDILSFERILNTSNLISSDEEEDSADISI